MFPILLAKKLFNIFFLNLLDGTLNYLLDCLQGAGVVVRV